jgi:hypothetical protein
MVAQVEPDVGQSAEQAALGVADGRERRGQRRKVVAPVRPIWELPEIIDAIHASIMAVIRRTGNRGATLMLRINGTGLG